MTDPVAQLQNLETSLPFLSAYLFLILIAAILAAIFLGMLTLPLFFLVIYLLELLFACFDKTGIFFVKVLKMICRGLRRNILRTSLTYVALFSLTFILTFLFAIIYFLGLITSEKNQNLKVIMTEKYSNPSLMPPNYERRLVDLFTELPPEMRPKEEDIMSWSFVGGTTDPTNPRPETFIFFFSLEPKKILTMMDGLERKDLNEKEIAQMEAAIAKMEANLQGVIVSPSRLKKMNLQVGDRIKVTSVNYKDIIFEYEIVDTLPEGKFEGVAMMNRQYMINQLDAYSRNKGQPHPLQSKCFNLIWVRMPTRESYEQLATLTNDPKNFSGPEVKLETASALLSSIFEGFKDIVFGIKYILAPAMIGIMTLVIANAISIGVREKRTELAVMKVLGFQPWSVATMVLLEALLIGFLAGLMSTFIAWAFIGSVKIQIAVIGAFFIPWFTIPLGVALGMGVSFLGSIGPAMSARKVKAIEVFSKVT